MRRMEIPILRCSDSNRSPDRELILICSSCGRLRDDEGEWNHAGGRRELNDIVISHGLCPECAKKYKAEIVKLIKG